MAAIIFFISSLGDTDLAKETIKELTNQACYVVPLTPTAVERTQDLINTDERLTVVSLQSLLNREALPKLLERADIEKLTQYIAQHNIEMAYVGVPSNNETLAYDIAKQLNISCIVANEYMFNDPSHAFWCALPELANKESMQFAVPLVGASEVIRAKVFNAKVITMGHLAIDRALTSPPLSDEQVLLIREKLDLKADQDSVFISGTTQPLGVDLEFIKALLAELATGNYPNLALRVGLHPGVSQKDDYLDDILKECHKYLSLSNQFKIILTEVDESKLERIKGIESPFLLRQNVPGAQAASVSSKIAQAVPGALLNEAVLLGKPGYFHNKITTPYLPHDRWSPTLTHFFNAKKTEQLNYNDLHLEEACAKTMAKHFRKH